MNIRKHLPLIFLLIILLFGFWVRLFKISNPIADWHSWRQADTSAVTRNYVKYGINLLYPRYDDFTDVSGKGLYNPNGYRFVEFPIFNLVHYFVFNLGSLIPSQPYDWIHYKLQPILDPQPAALSPSWYHKLAPHVDFSFWIIFGQKPLEYWGRLTSVFAALTSATLLFAIVRRHTSAITGVLAAGFYLLLPYNIYFTRVVLPDPLMVTLFLAALYFHSIDRRVLTLIFGALAIMVKPVAIFFLLPIYLKDFKLGLIMLAPFGLWRLWSHRFPEGIPASLWLLNGNRIRFRPSFFQWIFGTRLGILILGKWAIWPFLHGLFASPAYFGIWVIAALLYLFTFATGNVHHDYYQLPIIPIVSVLLALGSVHLWSWGGTFLKVWLSRIVLVITLAMGLAFSWYDIRGLFQVNNWSIIKAGQAVDRLTPPDSVVVAPYMGDTAFLYQTNRPGFPFMYMPIKDMIDRFSADYYVSVNYDDDTRKIMAKYIVIEETPEYVVVKLEEPIRP